MNVLVTGANGFAGSRLVVRLRAAGHRVVGTVRREFPGYNHRVHVVVRNGDSFARLLNGIDVVVHAAGVAHRSPSDEEVFFAGNRDWTHRLAGEVAESGAGTMIHLSSIAAAGYTEFADGDGPGLGESLQIAPQGCYGQSKREAELPVEALSHAGKLGVNLRPPLIYGHGARGNWPKLVRLARSGFPLPFGSVNNRRSFLGIDNLCSLVLAIIEKNGRAELSGTYHVADQELVSLREVISTLRAKLGRNPGLLAFPPAIMKRVLELTGRAAMGDGLFGDLVIDSRRVRSVFPFSPEVPTLAGMASSMACEGDES